MDIIEQVLLKLKVNPTTTLSKYTDMHHHLIYRMFILSPPVHPNQRVGKVSAQERYCTTP